MLDTLRQDVRYALRLWARRPAFAFVAILTLAIGIGANTAMFSIVNAVLLRPLPYAHADRLVSIWGHTASFPRGLLSYKEYEEIRSQSRTLDTIGVYLGQSVNLTGVNEPQRLVGIFASGSFFDVLGLKAERGRLYTEEESAPGTVKPVVVLSHQLWRQRFNEDPAAIGATMTVNGVPVTVIGIMAPPFDVDSVPAAGYFIGGMNNSTPSCTDSWPSAARSARFADTPPPTASRFNPVCRSARCAFLTSTSTTACWKLAARSARACPVGGGAGCERSCPWTA